MNIRSTVIAAILIATTLSSHAFEPTYLPGGDDVKAAVAARRGQTELSKLALSMEPGTWAELETDMPRGLWSAPRIPDPDGGRGRGGLHIGTWSDDAHWCSRTGQFLFFGVRQTRKFVAYSEEDNAWREIEFVGKDNAPGLEQRFGHQYSRNAFDPERSLYFTLDRRYDVVNDRWELQVEGKDPGLGSMTMAYSTALNGLLAPSGDRQNPVMRFFCDENREWSDLGPAHAHGYHGVARENPFRQEVIFMAGNDSEAMSIVDKKGNVRPMQDYPREGCGIRHHIITVDPQSGRYLIMDPPRREFYEFDADKNQYRLVDDFSLTPWVWGRHGSPLVAYIPEYGVSMWADSSVYLYKHDPDGTVPSIETKPTVRNLAWNSAVVEGDIAEGAPIPEVFVCLHPGEDAQTGSIKDWDQAIPVGRLVEAFDTMLDGLEGEQEYFVRLYASNYVGEAWSEPTRFSTGAAPEEPAQLTLAGNQRVDGEAPSIAFAELPDFPLFGIQDEEDWSYDFSSYGPTPTPLHLERHTLYSDEDGRARGRIVFDLNGGAILGSGAVAIRTFRRVNRSSMHIHLENVGAIDMGGIDTHAEQERSNANYHAGAIRIGTPEKRAGAIRVDYLHAYATGPRAGSADIALYGDGDVTIGTADAPGAIRTDTFAWDGANIVVDHFGDLTVGSVLAHTTGNRGGSRAGNISFRGNDRSGDAAIGSITAWNNRSNYSSSNKALFSIANYRHIMLGAVDGRYKGGEQRRHGSDLEIKEIGGDIRLSGKLDLSSTYKDNEDPRYRGHAQLACEGTVSLAELDLDLIQYIVLDSGSGTSTINGAPANFVTADATGAGTADDPKVSAETRLRTPGGQTVHYRYEAGGLNDALGGHVWQLRAEDGEEPGGVLAPRP